MSKGTTLSIPQRGVKAGPASQSTSLTSWMHLAVFLTSVLIVISRRPDAVLNPQFWAEDGTVFYAQAHNLSAWTVFFRPYAGYLCTLHRLTAALAQILPLAVAPLFFNAVAIFFQVLPVNFFVSSRFATLASMRSRLILCFLYLALPNSFEINANIANAQTHLAVLLCLVFMAAPATSLFWRCFDLAALALGSLSGPFSVMLFPLAGTVWVWKRRDRWTAVPLSVLALGALATVFTLARTAAAQRFPGELGASPLVFARIMASRIFVAALVGENTLYSRRGYAVLIAMLGIAALLYVLWNAKSEVKLFITFSGVALCASLLNPMAPPPKWLVILMASNRYWNRYWFLPMLAFTAALVWMVGNGRPRGLRIIAMIVLLMTPIGIVRDWRYPPFVDLHFREYARQYSALPSGSNLVIPLNPTKSLAGRDWSMTLTKR